MVTDPASRPVRLKLAVVWPAVMARVVVAPPSTMVRDAAVALVGAISLTTENVTGLLDSPERYRLEAY